MTYRAFKYRFYPTSTQEILLRRTFGCVRLVFNKALALRSNAWKNEKIRIGHFDLDKALTAWKKEDELRFLNEVSCVPLQQALRHLDKAFTNFFAKRSGYPKFKHKCNEGSAEFTRSAFKYCDGALFLAKLKEPLNVVWSRIIPNDAQPSTVTVKLDAAGRWFVIILCDVELDFSPTVDGKIGLDLGITSLITFSTGEKIDNPRYFDHEAVRLRKAQRRVDKKEKGSKNRRKAALKFARIHAKIVDRRNDNLHKLTTRIVQENQLIVIEDLAVKNMVRNHSLARVISDAGWAKLVGQLEYKAHQYGRTIKKVDRWFPSSKTCFNCGYIAESLPLGVRDWTCPACNAKLDRDVNAAKNILAAELAVSACGEGVRLKGKPARKQPSAKQEASNANLGTSILKLLRKS